MVTFKRDYTVYLNNDNKSESEFTFRRGYSYPCRDEGDYLIVGNNLKFDVYVAMSGKEIDEIIERS